MAGAYLHILRGDSYTYSTNIAVDGVSQNISGASLWFMATADLEDDGQSTPIINLNSASGAITISGNNSNVVTITMNAATTANFSQANVFNWSLRCFTGTDTYSLDRGLGCVSNTVFPS